MIGEIINSIWELPWYKVLVIAAADDVILLIKLWPLWLIMFLGFITIGAWVISQR